MDSTLVALYLLLIKKPLAARILRFRGSTFSARDGCLTPGIEPRDRWCTREIHLLDSINTKTRVSE